MVGGATVEFYTRGAYVTGDVDLIVPGLGEVATVLKSLGFVQRGLSFVHPVDLPAERLAGDPPAPPSRPAP